MSVGVCRTLNATTSHRLPIGLTTLACPCKPSWAGRSGTMSPCGLRCDIKSRRLWDQAMGCWCSTLLDFLSPAVSRSVWPDSGVGVWAQSTTAQWPCMWATSPATATARLDQAGVPHAYRASRTRHQWALEMLANNGAGWPHGWMSGDDEMGRP